MIPFEQIDSRLQAIGKNRAWLAESTPYSGDYLRTVLAPKSTRRTARVQEVISDAIEGEERRQREAKESPVNIPDRISIRARPEERDSWEECSLAAQLTLNGWIVAQLNDAARKWQDQEGKGNGTDG